MRSIISSILLLPLVILLSGCGVYSFTGSTLTPDMKTISIGTFYNNAALGPSTMTSLFTESIKSYFQKNTSLTFVNSNGDLQFEGYIADYTITPVSATSSGDDNTVDYATTSRITITVFCSYVNLKDDEFDFEQRFSYFKDYDSSTTDLTSNEDDFAQEIFDQIILDIFNASVANW